MTKSQPYVRVARIDWIRWIEELPDEVVKVRAKWGGRMRVLLHDVSRPRLEMEIDGEVYSKSMKTHASPNIDLKRARELFLERLQEFEAEIKEVLDRKARIAQLVEPDSATTADNPPPGFTGDAESAAGTERAFGN